MVVEDLVKHFRVHQRDAGVAAGVKSLFRRRYVDVRAVDGVSFSIAPGEMVGFLGPNGAGKTTTLKCLSGLLYPTSGRATVLGYTPHERKTEFLRSFTLVMGQRNQLFWDLPAMETFLVNQGDLPDPRSGVPRQPWPNWSNLLGLSPISTSRSAISAWGNGCGPSWRPLSCIGRRCCFSTSPPSVSTSPPPRRSVRS